MHSADRLIVANLEFFNKMSKGIKQQQKKMFHAFIGKIQTQNVN